MPATDREPPKLINTEIGRYSDRCSDCDHTRADHLASPQGLNIFAVDECTVLVCVLPLGEAHIKHAQYTCGLAPCDCDKWAGGDV